MFYHPQTDTKIVENTPFILDGIQYPANWLNLSSPSDKIDHNIFEIIEDATPSIVETDQYITENTLYRQGDVYVKSFTVNAYDTEQIINNRTREFEKFTKMVISSVQNRLDEFARSRNYDSILSACTYATSSITKFKNEGQYCVDARDATWETLYSLMAEVQAGTRQPVSTYAEVEILLPILTWPA